MHIINKVRITNRRVGGVKHGVIRDKKRHVCKIVLQSFIHRPLRAGVRVRIPRRPDDGDGAQAQHGRHHRDGAGRRADEVHLPGPHRRAVGARAARREDLHRGGAAAGLRGGRGHFLWLCHLFL